MLHYSIKPTSMQKNKIKSINTLSLTTTKQSLTNSPHLFKQKGPKGQTPSLVVHKMYIIKVFSFFLLLSVLLLSFSSLSCIQAQFAHKEADGCSRNNTNEDGYELFPLIDDEKVEMVMNESRRKLGSFHICAPCTCCGGPRGFCLASPCCYAINCNLPNRPFGFCAFTPRKCNCFGCHL